MKGFLSLILGAAALLLTAAEAGKPQPRLQVAKWYYNTSVPAGAL